MKDFIRIPAIYRCQWFLLHPIPRVQVHCQGVWYYLTASHDLDGSGRLQTGWKEMVSAVGRGNYRPCKDCRLLGVCRKRWKIPWNSGIEELLSQICESIWTREVGVLGQERGGGEMICFWREMFWAGRTKCGRLQKKKGGFNLGGI